MLAFPTHPNDSLLTPAPISVVLENCNVCFHVGSLCLKPLKRNSSLLLVVGCLLYGSLLDSAGRAHSLAAVSPELLRSFQAGERSRLGCSPPKRSHFLSKHCCLMVKSRKHGSPFPTMPAPHGLHPSQDLFVSFSIFSQELSFSLILSHHSLD